MFDFLKKTHRITYASVSFDGTRPYNEDSLKILDTDRRKLFILADGLGGCGDGKPPVLRPFPAGCSPPSDRPAP